MQTTLHDKYLFFRHLKTLSLGAGKSSPASSWSSTIIRFRLSFWRSSMYISMSFSSANFVFLPIPSHWDFNAWILGSSLLKLCQWARNFDVLSSLEWTDSQPTGRLWRIDKSLSSIDLLHLQWIPNLRSIRLRPPHLCQRRADISKKCSKKALRKIWSSL